MDVAAADSAVMSEMVQVAVDSVAVGNWAQLLPDSIAVARLQEVTRVWAWGPQLLGSAIGAAIGFLAAFAIFYFRERNERVSGEHLRPARGLGLPIWLTASFVLVGVLSITLLLGRKFLESDWAAAFGLGQLVLTTLLFSIAIWEVRKARRVCRMLLVRQTPSLLYYPSRLLNPNGARRSESIPFLVGILGGLP